MAFYGYAGVASVPVQTRDAGENIVFKPTLSTKFYRFDNEKSDIVDVSVDADLNSSRGIYTLEFPVPKIGVYNCVLSCEGAMPLKERDTKGEWKWYGIMAYWPKVQWIVSGGSGAAVKDISGSVYLTGGHKEAMINGMAFTDQMIECDFYANFKLHVQYANSTVNIQVPTVFAESHYNFCKSYSRYVDAQLELGNITITFDERDQPSTGLGGYSMVKHGFSSTAQVRETALATMPVVKDSSITGSALPPAPSQETKDSSVTGSALLPAPSRGTKDSSASGSALLPAPSWEEKDSSKRRKVE